MPLRLIFSRHCAKSQSTDVSPQRPKPGKLLIFTLALMGCSAAYSQSNPRYEELNQDCLQAIKLTDFAEGEKRCTTSLRAAEKLGAKDEHLANSLNNLAGVYYTYARYAEAIPLLIRARSILEQTLGPDHPRIAANLSFLGLIYDKQGNPSAAEPLLLRAVAIDEKMLGSSHPDYAKRLNNLGFVYYRMGQDAKAESFIKQSLAIRERVLGTDHPDIGTSLHNLGLLYSRQGRYDEAAQMLRRSIAIREKAIGTNHPALADSLTTLAETYRASGKLPEAELLARRAIELAEKQAQPNPRAMATYLNNLGGIYLAQGYFAEAVKLHERALALRETALGKDHPEVMTDRANLAQAKRLQSGELSLQQAAQTASIDQFLQGIRTEADNRCPDLKQLAEKRAAAGNQEEAEAIRSSMVSVCECMPAQAMTLRSTLSPEELASSISGTEFMQRFKPQLIDKCAATQAKAMLTQRCTNQTPATANSPHCQCLSDKIAALSDSEITDIGIAAADYLPRAAEAQKRGETPPEQPALINRFFAIDAECKRQ